MTADIRFDALPRVGEPGTAAPFQLQRLRLWGLPDLATRCTTREQAVLAHHCALFVRMVWQDMHGPGSEPPEAALRHCVGEIIADGALLDRAHQVVERSLEADDRDPRLQDDAELYRAVRTALSAFA